MRARKAVTRINLQAHETLLYQTGVAYHMGGKLLGGAIGIRMIGGWLLMTNQRLAWVPTRKKAPVPMWIADLERCEAEIRRSTEPVAAGLGGGVRAAFFPQLLLTVDGAAKIFEIRNPSRWVRNFQRVKRTPRDERSEEYTMSLDSSGRLKVTVRRVYLRIMLTFGAVSVIFGSIALADGRVEGLVGLIEGLLLMSLALLFGAMAPRRDVSEKK